MQNGIWHLGQIPPKSGHPKTPQVRRAQITIGPRPSIAARSPRGIASRGATSASLEGPPSRPLEARAVSASLVAPSAEPSVGPRHGGNLRLARDHPRQTEAAAQPPDGTGRIYSPTTPRHGRGGQAVSDGSSWRRPSCHTADVTGVSSTCARHCAAIPGTVQDCGALCGLA